MQMGLRPASIVGVEVPVAAVRIHIHEPTTTGG